MKQYKLIVFDFDGTLIDSVFSLTIMYQIAFKKLGIPYKDDDAYLYMKESLIHTCNRFNLNEEQIECVFKSFNDSVHSKEVIRANKMFPDTKNMIDYCLENHYKTAILTSNETNHVREVLEYMNLPIFYDVVIGCDSVSVPKPDPRGMNLILEKLKIDKNDTLYIGDSCHDMLTAENAGVDSILVDRHNEFDSTINYKKVSSLNEVIKLLKIN